MQTIVSNKQRQYKISLPQLKSMADTLSSAVLANLKEDKPIWIKANTLVFIKNQTAVNLVIVSSLAIRKLNKKWLGNDKVTDVLSFPLLDLDRYPTRKTNGISPQDGDDDQLVGEIFIAYEKACEQAQKYNHSVDRELAFLFVHGMLHILGFDHQDKTSEKDMFGRQRRILKLAGYRR